jgi:hypothetical protein
VVLPLSSESESERLSGLSELGNAGISEGVIAKLQGKEKGTYSGLTETETGSMGEVAVDEVAEETEDCD